MAVAALIIVLGGAGVAAYFLYFKGTVEPTPTPIASTTPTPVPLSQLERVAGTSLATVKLPASGYPYDAIKTFISSQTIQPGELTFYKVGSEQDKIYYFDEFIIRLDLTLPPNVDTSFIKNSNWTLGLYGQLTGTVDNIDNKAVIVAEVSDSEQAKLMMANWEATLPQNLETLFGYDLSGSSPEFVSDTYLGESFRYIKISDQTSGLAYAVVGKLLVLASSKDSFRAVVSLILSK